MAVNPADKYHTMSFDLPPDSDDEENIPDWLKGLQSEEGFGDSGDDPFGAEPAEDSPDWLGDPDDTGVFRRPAEPEPQDVPDWLASIRQAELDASASPDQDQPDAADEEGQDWLQNIRDEEASQQEAAGEGVSSGFLDRIQSLKEQEDQPADSGDQADWLSGLDQDSGESEMSGLFSSEAEFADEPAPSGSAGFDLGDFQLEGDVPDFYASEEPAPGQRPSDPEDTFVLDDYEPEGEMPDFFSDSAGESAAAGESPDRFDDLDPGGGDAGLPNFLGSEPAEPSQPSEGFPDFSGAAPQDQAAGFSPVSEAHDAVPEDQQGWFDSTEDQEPEEDPMDWFTAEGDGDEEDVPEWVLQLEAKSPFPEVVFPDESDLDESLDLPQSQADDGSLDWMSGQAQAVAGAGFAGPAFSGDVGGGVPDWLANLQEDGEAASGEPSAPAFEDAPLIDSSEYLADAASILEPTDLPDWLTQSSPAQAPAVEPIQPVESPVESSGDTADISPAELPSWLQAMRPVEAVAPAIDLGEEEERPPGAPESVGPLAGLSDVLPAEPDVVVFGKPAVPATGNGITETIQQYARMLEAMVASEEQAPPIRRRLVALPQQIMRVVIALVLYALVFVPVFSQSRAVSLPEAAAMPAESRAVFTAVEAVPSGAPVLIAFEYQPGFSGEINAAAAAVVDHLLDKGALPVLIASQPIGPGLGDYFLQTTQSAHPAVADRKYVNLGYISGGSAALLNFAADPRAAVPLPQEDGTSRWDQPPLQSVHTIRDFALVIVLTEDPDRARAWIEQVQPYLADPQDPAAAVPLLMAVSAQAEPMVLPYYQASPQGVNGLISGTKGGAFYEAQTNTQGPAGLYWTGYNAGLIIAVLVILIGGAVNLARSVFINRRQQGAQP